MGTVWCAHGPHNSRVAIKLLRSDASDHRLARQAFDREVRTVARLRHPNIVPIYDFGEVTAEEAERFEGQVKAGSPYLAMELIDGPSLKAFRGVITSETTRRLILETLEALAHSHARGIIHRDLKPSNILLQPRTDRSNSNTLGRARLTDFGIAHAFDREDSDGLSYSLGTPGFMAPEQRYNCWRDFGPWTDLFAVGKMTEDLLSRSGEDGQALKEVLAPWLAKMCAEHWSARFRRAADAALALNEYSLDGCDAGPVTHSLSESSVEQASTLITEPTEQSSSRSLLATGSQSMEPVQRKPLSEPPPVYRINNEWRPLVAYGSELLPPPSGLGLYGLRPEELIGREHERDLLWAALNRVAKQRSPSVIFLEGPTGAGKTALAQWLCELAHESGAAEILQTSFGGKREGRQGFGAMLGRHFRTAELNRPGILARLAPALREIGLIDPTEWLLFTDLIAADDSSHPDGFFCERQCRQLLLRFFARFSRRRPLLIWLDGVHQSEEAALLLADLQASVAQGKRSGAILIVATINNERCAWPSQIATQLRGVANRDNAETVVVEPLPV